MGAQSASNKARGKEDQRGEGLTIDHANKEPGAGSRSSTSHTYRKYLTCYFWYHRQYRESVAECSYTYYDTGQEDGARRWGKKMRKEDEEG